MKLSRTAEVEITQIRNLSLCPSILPTCEILFFWQGFCKASMVRFHACLRYLIRENPWVPCPIAFGLCLRLCRAVVIRGEEMYPESENNYAYSDSDRFDQHPTDSHCPADE